MFHSEIVRSAPAAARSLPSGLIAVVYSGLLRSFTSGPPTGAGWPGLTTSHSRSVPSAPATASSPRPAFRLIDSTTSAESISRAADGVPDVSSRLAVASGVRAMA